MMTDEEARNTLVGGISWVGWHDSKPDWRGGEIVLDGAFTKQDLLALLHFAPEDV